MERDPILAVQDALGACFRDCALLAPSLPLAARVALEPYDEPNAEDAGPARRLSQPDGTLSAAAAVHVPPRISKVAGALPLVVTTEHG